MGRTDVARDDLTMNMLIAKATTRDGSKVVATAAPGGRTINYNFGFVVQGKMHWTGIETYRIDRDLLASHIAYQLLRDWDCQIIDYTEGL